MWRAGDIEVVHDVAGDGFARGVAAWYFKSVTAHSATLHRCVQRECRLGFSL